MVLWKSVMALPGACHGSARIPSWLCKESVMALREVGHGGILPVEEEDSLHRWQIPPSAMTDCSHSSGWRIMMWECIGIGGMKKNLGCILTKICLFVK